jgi:hypothetical protein
MVHVSVQVVSSYVTPWLSNTCLISVIYFVITLYIPVSFELPLLKLAAHRGKVGRHVLPAAGGICVIRSVRSVRLECD